MWSNRLFLRPSRQEVCLMLEACALVAESTQRRDKNEDAIQGGCRGLPQYFVLL